LPKTIILLKEAILLGSPLFKSFVSSNEPIKRQTKNTIPME